MLLVHIFQNVVMVSKQISLLCDKYFGGKLFTHVSDSDNRYCGKHVKIKMAKLDFMPNDLKLEMHMKQ